MTPEQRFDRLERIWKLMARAGLRGRRQLREQNEKINIILDAQVRFTEAQVKNEERFAKLAEAQTELAASQSHTDRRLDALIDIVRKGRNGKSQ